MKPKHAYIAAGAFISANLMVAASWASPALGLYCCVCLTVLWGSTGWLSAVQNEDLGAEIQALTALTSAVAAAFVFSLLAAVGEHIAQLQAAGQ